MKGRNKKIKINSLHVKVGLGKFNAFHCLREQNRFWYVMKNQHQ